MSTIFASLPLLACPIGMGAMMWWMMRTKKDGASAAPPRGPVSGQAASPASVELLKEEHRRLGQQIEQIESGEQTAPRS